jgi:signal transduction histidine kinase
MPMTSPSTRQIFLSTLTAGRKDRRQALVIVVPSLVFFLALAPFAAVQLPAVFAFIPIYESALAINDLITAILLLGQVNLLRSPALLMLAAGYLFTALMAVAHMLSFPGLFAPMGLLGAGSQTTAWLYMFWHTGFPLAVIGYALLKDREGLAIAHPHRAIALIGGLVAAIVCGVTLLATAGHDLLPRIMNGSVHTPAMAFVISSVWIASVIALAVLWLRRPHSVLDMWLAVVMCAWVFDVALSAMFSGGRFDIGFYAGRIYGLSAASLVLLVLLLETGSLYARLADSMAAEREERERRLQEAQALLIHMSRVSELGLMVPALVHEVNQPLTAVGNYLDALGSLIRTGDAAKAETMLQKAVQQVERAGQILRRLRNFVRREEPRKQSEPVADLIEEGVALASIDSRSRGVAVEARIDPRASAVLIDKIQIQQVLLNLLRNAFEAMADRPRRTLVIAAAPAGAEMIEITVADTGPGLSSEVRAKLFEPFVTTKAAGMGVGLSICRSIIESHGGTLSAGDNPGGGTIFRFTLPAVGAALARAASVVPAA